MTRAAKGKPKGQFTLLVPDLPQAESLHFFGPPHGMRGHAAASKELARHSFDELRQFGANQSGGSTGSASAEARP